MRRKSRFAAGILLGGLLILALGCGQKRPTVADAAPSKHEHQPPHGGTPVVLGDEEYHLEFVLDPSAGKLSAYILDDEMDAFVRISAPSFMVTATSGGKEHDLIFLPIANRATGETVGDTALFEASAGWLKTAKEFDGVLASIEIRGTTFADVAFNFPKGNDAD